MRAPIVEQLKRRSSFAILSHLDPDGDAIGSALGLAHVLERLGKRATVHLPGGAPRMYEFLPGAERVRADFDASGIDAVIVLDATSPDRLADLAFAVHAGLPVLNVDHHVDNVRFGDHVWVDPTFGATALMVHDIATAGEFDIDADAATCLYTGVLTDTGRFTFSNADARALQVAGELVRLGAKPHEIAHAVYERFSEEALRLLGQVLSTLDLRDGGRVACLHATRAMLAETGATTQDAEGFATYARSVAGVQVGLFLREMEDGMVKVSFRSNEGVPIHGVAGQFGGGGHPSASGARVSGPIAEAKEAVLRAVSEHLRSLSV
jgi:phosphoesterase RecJ-like protein